MDKNKKKLKSSKLLLLKAPKSKIEKKHTSKSNLKIKKPIISSDSESDSGSQSSDDSFSNSESLRSLLEPCSKSQLIDLITEQALEDRSLVDRILNIADMDESHRKIFIHGLAYDATCDTVKAAFESDGEIEDCHVVTDRTTGKAKGFGFVLFKTRRDAARALKAPRKKIGNRLVSFQLASSGPAPSAHDVSGRKIYVSNVPVDIDPEKLLKFFSTFGEIEAGPVGFDVQTGKSRGFALFVYKSPEGALKALEDPRKVFESHHLLCQKANDGKPKLTPPVIQQPSPLAALAPQNMMFNQYGALNPVYGQFMAAPTSITPNLMTQGSPFGGMGLPTNQMNQLGAGLGVYNASLLGPYASSNHTMGLQSVYPNPQFGLLDSTKVNGKSGLLSSSEVNGTGGSILGLSSYMR